MTSFSGPQLETLIITSKSSKGKPLLLAKASLATIQGSLPVQAGKGWRPEQELQTCGLLGERGLGT